MPPPPPPPPPPRALLFDWDNTLIDSWPSLGRASNITLAAMGHATWSEAEIRARIAGSLRDTFPRIFGDRWEEAREIYYRAFEQVHLEMLRVFPGAAEFLRAAAKSGIYAAVVSNKTGKYLRAEAAHLGWNPLFGRLIGAQDAPRDKPEIDPVLMALEPSGLKPAADVWLIGDNAIDIACARNAGCTSVLMHELAASDALPPDIAAADFASLARSIGISMS